MISRFKRLAGAGILSALNCVPPGVMEHLLFLLRNQPQLTDRWGYHIRPVHYYEPLPDFQHIQREQLERRRESPAVDYRLDAQLGLIRRLGEKYAVELERLNAMPQPDGFDFSNVYFSGLDASVYYALIRDLRPRLVVEIGSGFSTQIASHAMKRNLSEGHVGRLVCVEPYPEERLVKSGAAFELVRMRVQDLNLQFFDELDANDILMMDSSHVATAGSDVCFELLEILPRLKPGVWVHVHDIFFPTDYPAEWVLDRRHAFNEQYMLEAFLAFNSAYSVQIANAWLAREQGEAAGSLFRGPASFAPPASFWMKREPS